jgi:hypothetical protein
MIVINLKGGLGNQMFQYALAYCMAKENNISVACDLRYLKERKGKKNYVDRDYELEKFGIIAIKPSNSKLLYMGMLFGNYRVRYLLGKIFDRIGICVLSERNTFFEERIVKKKVKNIYVDGYWQSEQYFEKYKQDIVNLFKVNETIERMDVIELIKEIKGSLNNVCLNVRRGDFVGSKNHDVITMEYYQRAIKILTDKVGRDISIYIFSDDPEWCSKNLKELSSKIKIVGHEFSGNSFSTYFYLMTQFTLFIIPNSTFAWWAAWLADSKNKVVIAPKIWSNDQKVEVADIVPKTWLAI